MKILKFLLIFFIIILIVLIIPLNVLIISDGSHNYIEFIGEKEMEITYNHSVEKSNVIEIYKVNESGIYLIKMEWKDFGAGLPQDYQYINNGYYVKVVNIYIGKNITYWFIKDNQAKIIVDGKLLLNVNNNSLIKIKVEKWPIILILMEMI
jgi:hypothetical protein